ncbi:type II toxin-antitoxin system VapC family toxin [bacterium]|nr:type II toxin-antitoxin system VapC family toxin [bacterium]
MADRAFVDTNVLLRAMIPRMNQHTEVEALIQKMWEDDIELWINRQVIREYLVQATHPRSFDPELTIEQVMSQIEIILTLFRVADETPEVTRQLLALLKSHPTRGKQVHDVNLVATMLVYEIDTLLTLNVDDLKRFKDKVEIVSIRDTP